MKNYLVIKSLLHQLGIGISYNGYNYILYGLTLILENEFLLVGITKSLYIDIGKRFHTTSTCVERSIRRVVDVIWSDTEKNCIIIRTVFGERYLTCKPTNKVFLEMLFEYVKNYELLRQLSRDIDLSCSFCQNSCEAYNEIIARLVNLE